MRSHLLLGCLLLFLNIIAVKSDVVIMSVRNKALVGVLTGVINLENLADIKLRISQLEEYLANSKVGIPLKDALANSNVTSPSPPMNESSTETLKEKNNCNHKLDALKAVVSEFLIKTLEGDHHDEIMNSIITEVYGLPAVVFGETIEAVLEKTYKTVDHDKILALIARNKNIPQAIAGINALFEKIKSSEDLNNSILFNLTSALKKLKNQTDFASLDPTEKYTFRKLVDNLPTCAKNLFFEPEICFWFLKSKQFMYVQMPDAEPVIAPFKVSRYNDAFAFESLGARNNCYLYASDRFTYKKDTFRSVHIGENAPVDLKSWVVELVGDYCYLKNVYCKEFLFSDNKCKSSTRTQRDTDILWQVRKCTEKN